jgi:adenylate kinase
MFVLIAPQNAVGNCIIDVNLLFFYISCSTPILNTCIIFTSLIFIVIFLKNLQDMRAMTDAAGDRPVILVNPRLKVFSK